MIKKIFSLPITCLLLLILTNVSNDIFAQSKKKKNTANPIVKNKEIPQDNVYGTYKLFQIFTEDKIQTEELKYSELVWLQKDSSIKIYVGCNRMSGKAILVKDSVQIQSMISTEMYCNGSVQTIEDVVKDALQKVNNIKYLQKKVYLYENEKLLIIASKIK